MSRYKPITPQTTSLIYNIIRQNGEINRMGITEMSGVSKSTISIQINRLLNLGMIEERFPSDKSQRKLKLKICENIGHVAGVFLGRTKLSMAIFSLDMNIVCEKEYFFESIEEPVSCNEEIIFQLRSLCQDHGIKKLWGIGFGFPFIVNFNEGKPDSPPNIPLWHNYPLKELYQKEFSCPVLIEKDVNVMALGESFRGCAINDENFLFVKIGTGIGAGLIVKGEIYRGANGGAGDIGHVAVNNSSVQCFCGNKGCLEAIVGGQALAEIAKQIGSTGDSAYLKTLLENNIQLSAEHIGQGAAHGDFGCIQLIKDTGRAIGEVLSKFINFFNPSSIVLGGGLTGLGHILIGAIREVIISESPHLATYKLNICISELKGKSGPIGAGTLILEHIFSNEEFSTTVNSNIKL